jgi:signal transduction histidine kinase
MMPFLDLSFRHKIPLWGSMLIIITAFAVSASLVSEAYSELQEDLLIDAETLGQSLTVNLFPAMLHDDTWRTFEIIRASIDYVKSNESNTVKLKTILVVDNGLRVVASAHPKSAPILTDLRQLSPEYADLADWLAQTTGKETREIILPDSKHIFFATPIAQEGLHLGTLIMVYPEDVFWPRFTHVLWRGLLAGLLVLAFLLPINWYWGQRMAIPLVQLTARMGEMGKKWPESLNYKAYGHNDELGRLFEAYNQMLHERQTKEALEIQIVQSERLAAVGQLAAGIAHEINNPLSGMLTAIDTLKWHGDVNPQTMKTITLIERGLGQIKETVGALLVESKLKSRDLVPQDIEDVLTLITPMASKKALHVSWHNSLNEEIPLPATFVRQIMINLLLNAVQAADQQGEVAFDIGITDKQLQLSVTNSGKMLSAEQITHLFEPFSPLSEGGHGLGLWVTYQIVHQFGGHIVAERESSNHMRFAVDIPIGSMA